MRDFKNPGRPWRPKKNPEPVRGHDVLIPEPGKATPHGAYDLNRDVGWMSEGIDHDTASFAVNAVRRWWKLMGGPAYPDAEELLILNGASELIRAGNSGSHAPDAPLKRHACLV